jgi:hypothetical protein
MIFVLMTMLLDSGAAPIGLMSVTAAVNGTSLIVSGRFEAGSTVPMLIWPRKDSWTNPCSRASDLCCLRDVLLDYQNDALQKVQGPKCMSEIRGEFVAASRSGVRATSATTFTATVPTDTPFVAMLFVNQDPFYILDGVQTFHLTPEGMLKMTAVVQNNPCYNVQVPGKPFKICMHCNNRLRPNAAFTWTPTWYLDYECNWQCNDGFAVDLNVLDPQCAPLGTSAVPLQYVAWGVGGVFVLALVVATYRHLSQVAIPPPEPPEAAVKPSEMIQFKENTITPFHIRIKMN